jgi:hypothetical protein
MLDRMNITKWTVVAATIELVVAGLILLVRPQLFAWLVYGAEFSDAGKALGWLTGKTWPACYPPATVSISAASPHPRMLAQHVPSRT